MITDLTLERFLLGELSPAETSSLQRSLDEDPALRARLDAMKRDTQATLATYSARVVAAEVNRRAEAAAPSSDRRWIPALVLVAAALTVGVFALQARTPDDDVRIKGDGPTLKVFLQTSSKPQRLTNGSNVHAHDLVQVGIDVAEQKFAVVVSIDAAGQATLHAAYDSAALATTSVKMLDHAFELDDTPGFERFFLVTDTQPLTADEVLRAAQALAKRPDAKTGPLDVRSGATVRSLLLEKVTP